MVIFLDLMIICLIKVTYICIYQDQHAALQHEDPSMDHCFEGTWVYTGSWLIAGVSDTHIGRTLHCHAHVKL